MLNVLYILLISLTMNMYICSMEEKKENICSFSDAKKIEVKIAKIKNELISIKSNTTNSALDCEKKFLAIESKIESLQNTQEHLNQLNTLNKNHMNQVLEEYQKYAQDIIINQDETNKAINAYTQATNNLMSKYDEEIQALKAEVTRQGSIISIQSCMIMILLAFQQEANQRLNTPQKEKKNK